MPPAGLSRGHCVQEVRVRRRVTHAAGTFERRNSIDNGSVNAGLQRSAANILKAINPGTVPPRRRATISGRVWLQRNLGMVMKASNWLPEAAARAVAHAQKKGAVFAIDTTATVLHDQEIPFLVRIVASLQQKSTMELDNRSAQTLTPRDAELASADSAATTSALDLAEQAATSHLETADLHDPFLPYEEDLYVGDVPPAHVCLLNKFNVVNGHLLIVTRAFQEQTLLLTSADFTAFWHCLRQHPSLGFYNSGKIAGASQRHKHMQLIPLAAETDIPIHVQLEKAASAREEQHSCFTVSSFPFKHAVIGTRDLESSNETDAINGAILHARYMQLLQFLIEKLGVSASSWIAWETTTSGRLSSDSFPVEDQQEAAHPFPYNLLLSRNWMLLVPRQQEKFLNEISVNALGFGGFLLAKNEAQKDLIVQHGPLGILKQVAIPWDA